MQKQGSCFEGEIDAWDLKTFHLCKLNTKQDIFGFVKMEDNSVHEWVEQQGLSIWNLSDTTHPRPNDPMCRVMNPVSIDQDFTTCEVLCGVEKDVVFIYFRTFHDEMNGLPVEYYYVVGFQNPDDAMKFKLTFGINFESKNGI